MPAEATVTKEDTDKADREARAAEAVEEAKRLADAEAKRLADEREATKASLDLIILLRGLARALSPHGAASLAGALDGIANSVASGKKPEDEALVDVAFALKDSDRNWDLMVKRINDTLRPAVIQDRSVVGILRAVENREVTVDQGQQLLQEAPKVQTPETHDSEFDRLHAGVPDPDAKEVNTEYQAWLAERNRQKNPK